MANSKRSRAEVEQIKASICKLVQEMYDVKAIAAMLNIHLCHAYRIIKELGFRKELITSTEREQLRRQRYEQHNSGGTK